MRTDWRWTGLVPALSFGLVLILGIPAWQYWMLQVVPDFGAPALRGATNVRSALGAAVAGQHLIVTATLVLVVCALALASMSARTVWSIHKEAKLDKSHTRMEPPDHRLSIWLPVILCGITVVLVIAGNVEKSQCGLEHFYQCLGKGVLPDLLDSYFARMFVGHLRSGETLDQAATIAKIFVLAAGFALLVAMTMLPRGLEKTSSDQGRHTIAQVKEWFARRMRCFDLLSFLTSLLLVASIALLSVALNWPTAIMTDAVFMGGGTVAALKASYEAAVNGVLQFCAVWSVLMVGILLFTTRYVMSKKCRKLAGEILGRPGTSTKDKEEAQKLVEQTFAGTDVQVYFERYRTYLLALAPAIAQQLLETFGK